jgi:SAM-dependent methyltransferase
MERAFESTYHDVEAHHWWSVARRDVILRLADRLALRGPVLDVGCASGHLVEALSARGVDARGIDISVEAVARARGRGVDVRLGPAHPIEAPDHSVEAIIASDVLEHLDDDVAALCEWRRVLVPGGTLIAFVPAHRWLWSAHDEANHHRRRYAKRQLQSALQRAGFESVRTSAWNVGLFLPVAAARSLQRMLPQRSHDLGMPAPWVNRTLTALLCAENRWLAKRDLPLGVSLFTVALSPGRPPPG